MLPAPPSSCAGWWFSQLWRALLAHQPERHGNWTLAYPEPGEMRARLRVAGPRFDTIAGSFHEGAERRCIVAWDWPGEDGMQHTVRALWQPGEVVVRPLEWSRLRRPFPRPGGRGEVVPWPLRVHIHARGWHRQLLEKAELEAGDDGHIYPVLWPPPPGEPRLPETELPCALTGLDRQPDSAPALILAGLPLPWQINLDREAWPVWRRFSAGALLDALGGPGGVCPRHGHSCPWPATGRAAPV